MRLFYLLASIVLGLATSACVLIDVQSGIRPDDDLLQFYQIAVGMLLVSFPVLAFYHQFVSRRWQGIATVFGLLLILLAPWVLWIQVYALR